MGKENFMTRLDNKLGAKHPELWKLVKFFIAGGISNIPELGSYMLCLYLFGVMRISRLPGFLAFMERFVKAEEGSSLAAVVYAYMISTAIGYTVAFILNRKATFKADSNVALSTLLYVIMVLFTIFANGLIGPVISDFVGGLIPAAALAQILSKLLGMAVPGLWTYPCNRFVIHRKRKSASV
ncbi:MAG: GtrA family protein [Oscillospiraceae bacterium]|jgi:putative flippase GtrA|nr:GtrA family protein [Oscillospiraceae bacterium]